MVADGIWENEGPFEHAAPFTIKRNTDMQGSEIVNVNADFTITANAEAPALTLEDGVTLNLGAEGQFTIGNAGDGAIAAPSESGYNNVLNLEAGTFDISASGTAIDGKNNLQLSIGTGGSIVGNVAVENLYSFGLNNNTDSYLEVTGLLDLSNAAKADSGGVMFADGAAIRLIPREAEKSTGTFGGSYAENGNTYINLKNGPNVTFADSLNVAVDVKNFYPDAATPNTTQRIKLMELNNVTALQGVLRLTVENNASPLPGWNLSYADDLDTVYAKFSPSRVVSIGTSQTVTQKYGPNYDEATRYVFDTPNSTLTISSSGAIESDGETPILIDTSIIFGTGINIVLTKTDSADPVAINNTNGIAIGQGTANGSSPYSTGDSALFWSPQVNITGTGTIRGSKGSFKICATEVSRDVDYLENRSAIGIGALTIGGSGSAIHMDGPIEMRIFDKDFGTADVQLNVGASIIHPFTLNTNSSISGHLLLDGSLKADGTLLKNAGVIIEGADIFGRINGRVNDTYGVCITGKSWAVGGEICSQVGPIGVHGNITAHAECPGNYTGVIIDVPGSGSSINGIELSGNIDAVAGYSSSAGVRIGAVVHAPTELENFTVHNSITGKNAALVFDGSGADALRVPIMLIGATLNADRVAIGGRNAKLHFASGSILSAASTAQFAIAPCAPTYTYNSGATDVTALKTFAYETNLEGKFSSIDVDDLALLRGSNLTFQLNVGEPFNANTMDIAVTGMTLGGSNTITCKKLFLGGSAAIAAGNTLHVADGIVFCADASVDNSRASSRLSIAGAEGVLGTIPTGGNFTGVSEINASFAAVGGEENSYGALIDISTTNAAAILPGGISGNLSNGEGFTTDAAEKYVTVALGGAGGSIGSTDVAASGISNVGKLLISGNSDDSVWTINGNTSCGTLRIEMGKLVQKGNLTVWGDLLLLGCDVDWTGNASFNHVYAGEDKITVRSGASVKISNGFPAESVGDETLTLVGVQLKREAVLLGGNSQFIVEPGATVSISVAGCADDKYGTDAEPVAIRVVGNSLKLGEACRQWPTEEQIIGNRNVIDLQNSLDLSYYRTNGTRIVPNAHNATAIRGNETTRLYLSGGIGEIKNLTGAISNVGYVTVNGHWDVPQGLDECGCLTLGQSGHLNCAGADVNTWRITFCLDDSRDINQNSDIEAYLTCNKLCNNYRNADAPICFNFELSNSLLENPGAFNFCLVSGLSEEPHWVCGTKINGIEPAVSYDNGKIFVLIPAMVTPQTMGFGNWGQLNAPSIIPRNVEFTPPDEYTLRSLWEQGLLVPYSVHQATITRWQNDLFRRALGLKNGNFANAGACRWCLTRTSYAGFLRRHRAGPIINAVSANACGSTIGLERKLPQGHLLAIVADYTTSHAHLRVWNNSRSCRCRMKGYGLGVSGQFVNGPMHFGLIGILNENSHRYGRNMERLANVRFSGYSYNLAGNFSYALQCGKWIISPRMESNFDNVYHKDYTIDHGNMGISPCRTKFFQSALGVCASMHREALQVIADLSLHHDFQCSGGFSKAVSSQNSCVTMPAYFPKRDQIDGKLQVSIPWRKSWEFAFDCDMVVQERAQNCTIRIGSIYHF
ncbi:MAG: hypothetical protein LBB26_01875 [Puniceicoccales bacterium]|jgi:hypothetical protein|nr:hypothetical protein [Puniceicoccales bacterium]